MIIRIKNHTLSLLKHGLYLTLFVVATLAIPEVHESYLRKVVGDEVVEIIGPDGGGTGFHVTGASGENYIMTNVHICEMSKNNSPLLVKSQTGDQYIPRRVVYMSKEHDICLMEPIPGHTGVKLASSVDIGETVAVIGHPQLRPLTMEKGEVIDKDSLVIIAKYIILNDEMRNACGSANIADVPTFFGTVSVCVSKDYAYEAKLITYPGNSGSPVINKYGHVIGLLFAGNTEAVNDTYLVKLEYLKEVLDMF